MSQDNSGCAVRYYAGIGSRSTPPGVLEEMRELGEGLAALGYVLRSGAAHGADTSFERGACNHLGGQAEIWLPWKGFGFRGVAEASPAASSRIVHRFPAPGHYLMAAQVHPAWPRLSQGARKLHARNVGQVLGEDLQTPVDFVLCWTPDGCRTSAARTTKTGGTGTAIAVADRMGIPVFNLWHADWRETFLAHPVAPKEWVASELGQEPSCRPSPRA